MLLLLQGYGTFAPPSVQPGLIFDPGHHTTYLRSSSQHTRMATAHMVSRQSVGRRGSAYRARKKIMRKDTPDAHD